VVFLGEAAQPVELVGRRCFDQNLSVAIVKHHRQQIVCDDAVRDFRHLREDCANVQHGRDRA
jgi:hypothetical protein